MEGRSTELAETDVLFYGSSGDNSRTNGPVFMEDILNIPQQEKLRYQ